MTSANLLYQTVLSKLDDLFHCGTGNLCAISTVAIGGILSLAIYTFVYFIRGSKINSKGRPSNSKVSKPSTINKEKPNNNTTATKKIKKVEKKKEDETPKKKPLNGSPTSPNKVSEKKDQVKGAPKSEPLATPDKHETSNKTAKAKKSKVEDNATGEWITVVSKKDKKQPLRPSNVIEAAVKETKTNSSRTMQSPTKQPIAATFTKKLTEKRSVAAVEKPKVDENRVNVAPSVPLEPLPIGDTVPQINGQKSPLTQAVSVKSPAITDATLQSGVKNAKKLSPKVANGKPPASGKPQQINDEGKIVKTSKVVEGNVGDVDPDWTEIRSTKKRSKARKE